MKENNQNLVPAIRFKGFTNAWEKRELSDLMIFSNGINASKESYGIGRKMISVKDILAEESVTYETIRNSVSVDKRIEEKNKVEKGDLVFVRSSEISEEVGWARAYLQDEYALYSGFSIRGKRKNNYDAYFIELSLNHINRKQIESKAGGSTRFNVSQEILNSIIILEPGLDEQVEISSFFKQLDDTITLHKRKLDGLRELKKGYLQQMFPQAGERVPRVRFDGFSGEWEQRKLGEVTEKVKSYSLSRDVETDEETGYRYIHYGDIHKQIADLIIRDEQLPCIDRGDYLSLRQGDLVLADASEDYTGIAEPSVILHEPTDKIIAGLHTIALRPQNADSLYLYYLCHTERFKKYGGEVGTGLKVFGITFNNLSLYETQMPTLPEQTAIGNFFRSIDEQIAKQTQKIEQLQQLKSAYLKKMFI